MAISWVNKEELKRLRGYWFFKVVFVLAVLALIAVIFLFFLPQILPTRLVSNASVGGIIFQNQIWEGTVQVIGDTVSVPGATVIIKPGTKVQIFRQGDRFNIDYLPKHLKNGINTGEDESGIKKGEPFWDEKEKVQLRLSSLQALGTFDRQISITSDSDPGSPYDINLIAILRGKLEYVNLSNYRRLEIGPEVTITKSNFSNTGECAVCVSYDDPKVGNSVFKNSKRFYISVGAASPEIVGNQFLESEGEGVIFEGDSFSNVRLSENFFYMPGQKALRVISAGEGGTISRNFFSTGDLELPCGSKVEVKHNWIRGKVIFDNPLNCTGEYTFGENYWEILDRKSVLLSRVVGGTSKFQVKIPAVLDNPPKGVASR